MIKRGRPAKGSIVGKSAAFATRITPDLRRKLEDTARENARSLSQEAEFRLSASFAAEKEGKRHTHQTDALVRLIAEAISEVENCTGQRWQKNPFTYDLAVRAVNHVLGNYKPRGAKRAPPEFPIPRGVKRGSREFSILGERRAWPPQVLKQMRREFLKNLDHLPGFIANNVASLAHRSATDPSAPFPQVYREAAAKLAHYLTFDPMPPPPTKTRRRK